jgi:ribose 5-phosphate isomerase B
MASESELRAMIRDIVHRLLDSQEAEAIENSGKEDTSSQKRAKNIVTFSDKDGAKTLITQESISTVPRGGEIQVPPESIITPLARDTAREREIKIVVSSELPRIEEAFGEEVIVKIALGCDHSGVELKDDLKLYLKELGYDFKDYGTFSSNSPVDYPDIAAKVAYSVAKGECHRGIMIDGVGIGSCIVANKIPGIRAALGYDLYSARSSREHNNANVLTLGARAIGKGLAREIVKVWLETEFAGGRHSRRVAKISALERKEL